VSDSTTPFNFESFYRALNATREARQLTWKQVGDAADVGASTLARMAQNRRPDADGLASLSAWAGLNPADFVNIAARPLGPEPLAQIARALHQDKRLSPDDAAAIEDIVRAAYSRLQRRER
jgi:transcriptional regulator with XRE-family HTH domain